MLSPTPDRGCRGPVRGWRLPSLVLLLTFAALLPVAAPAAIGNGKRLVALPNRHGGSGPATSAGVVDAGHRGGHPRVRRPGRAVRARAPGDRHLRSGRGVVRAPAAGRIGFAGPVAGTTWVSLVVAPGVRVTLGPLLDPITAGRVPSRAPLGRVGPGHRAGSGEGTVPTEGAGSGLGATLHLSVRVDGVYVDPLAYLIDRPRPRLAPLPTPGGLPDR